VLHPGIGRLFRVYPKTQRQGLVEGGAKAPRGNIPVDAGGDAEAPLDCLRRRQAGPEVVDARCVVEGH